MVLHLSCTLIPSPSRTPPLPTTCEKSFSYRIITVWTGHYSRNEGEREKKKKKEKKWRLDILLRDRERKEKDTQKSEGGERDLSLPSLFFETPFVSSDSLSSKISSFF